MCVNLCIQVRYVKSSRAMQPNSERKLVPKPNPFFLLYHPRPPIISHFSSQPVQWSLPLFDLLFLLQVLFHSRLQVTLQHSFPLVCQERDLFSSSHGHLCFRSRRKRNMSNVVIHCSEQKFSEVFHSNRRRCNKSAALAYLDPDTYEDACFPA